MSETVERRLLDLLKHPTESPFGNPIPGLHELGEGGSETGFREDGLESLADAAGAGQARVQVRRISEELQKDEPLMGVLRRVGALPGEAVTVSQTEGVVSVGSTGEVAELDPEAAEHIFVRRVS